MKRCSMLLIAFSFMLISFGASCIPAATVKCALYKDRPEIEPNIYLCSKGYNCCTVYGYHSCCAEDINLPAEVNSILIYVATAMLALFIAFVVHCYFEDFDPSEIDIPDDDDDLEKICDGVQRSKMVEDPIFGIVPYETAPPYAALDKYGATAPSRGYMHDQME